MSSFGSRMVNFCVNLSACYQCVYEAQQTFCRCRFSSFYYLTYVFRFKLQCASFGSQAVAWKPKSILAGHEKLMQCENHVSMIQTCCVSYRREGNLYIATFSDWLEGRTCLRNILKGISQHFLLECSRSFSHQQDPPSSATTTERLLCRWTSVASVESDLCAVLWSAGFSDGGLHTNTFTFR